MVRRRTKRKKYYRLIGLLLIGISFLSFLLLGLELFYLGPVGHWTIKQGFENKYNDAIENPMEIIARIIISFLSVYMGKKGFEIIMEN